MKNTYSLEDHNSDIESAMKFLIVSSESLRERLTKSGRSFALIPSDNLPTELYDLHKKIIKQLTKYKAPCIDAYPFSCDVYTTVNKLKSSSQLKIANDIWLFYKKYIDTVAKI